MLVPMITGVQVAFWLLAPVIVALAIGMVVAKKPVHSALCLGGVMLGLAVQYAALQAPFLFVTQIIVYTGSVMMLFVFTMMLMGVDSRESLVETIKGQRIAVFVLVTALAVLLIATVARGFITAEVGMLNENGAAGGNVQGIATLILSDYVVAFEVTAALLITGALASMVLAHTERLKPKENQKARLQRRMSEYAEKGTDLGPLPNSGVYARHNAANFPALLPDGTPAESSVPPTLVSRGVAVVDSGQLIRPLREAYGVIDRAAADADGRVPVDLTIPVNADAVQSDPELTGGEEE